MEWCLVSGKHWRVDEKRGTVGEGDGLYKLRWSQAMVTPKCQEEELNLLCEQWEQDDNMMNEK